jgi:hypothetical protein
MGKKRISKRVREEAALFAQVRACEWAAYPASTAVFGFARASEDLGTSGPAVDLVCGAFDAIPAWCTYPLSEQWAEAEALLRTGWSPT